MKALKKILLILIIVIGVAWLGLYAAVKVFLPPEKIRSLVKQHGSELLGREISINDASVGVFPSLKVSIQGLRLANAEGFSPEPLLRMREMALEIDFFSLLRLSPVIREIRLVEPHILYEVNALGGSNLDGLIPADTTPQPEQAKQAPPRRLPAQLALQSFRIVDGKVAYKDLQTEREVTLGDIDQNVAVTVRENLQEVVTKGLLEITAITLFEKGMGLRKGDISVKLSHEIILDLAKESVELKALQVSLQEDVTVSVRGVVSDLFHAAPVLSLQIFSNEMRVASLLKEVPPGVFPELAKVTGSGVIRMEAEVKGKLDTVELPQIRGRIQLQELKFSHAEVPASLEGLNSNIHFTENSLSMEDFGFAMAGNPVSVQLIVSQFTPVPVLQSLLVDATVDLGGLVPLAAKMAPVPAGLVVEGMVRSKLQAQGELDPAKPQALEAQGEIIFDGVKAASPEMPVPVSADGKIIVDNQVIKQEMDVKLGESDIRMESTVRDYLAMALPELAQDKITWVTASITSDFLDLDKLLPRGGDAPPEEESVPISALPLLPQFGADISMRLAKTKFFNLEMTEFNSKTEVRDRQVRTNQSGKLYTGSFAQRLHLDLGDTTNPKINLFMDVNRVEANDFISRLNDELPVGHRLTRSLSELDNTLYGKFDMKADLATHGLPQTMVENLTGTVLLKTYKGRLAQTALIQNLSSALGKIHKTLEFGEMTFDAMNADMKVLNGELLVENFTADNTPVGHIVANGKVGLDNSIDMALETRLPPAASRLVLSAGSAAASAVSGLLKSAVGTDAIGGNPIPKDKSGRASLFFDVGGTLTKPNFALNSERMVGGATEKAKQALEAELEKKKAEVQAKLEEEKRKLQGQAEAQVDEQRRKLEAEKRKLEEKAQQEKKKAEEKAKEEAKKKLKQFGL